MTRPSWPYLPQSLLRLQHIFLPHPRGKCLSTDCPVVIIDSVICVNYASSLGMFFRQLSSRHWWCGDMCQSCVYMGSVCSLIVQSSTMIHYVSVLCLHWEWQVHRLSSRYLDWEIYFAPVHLAMIADWRMSVNRFKPHCISSHCQVQR